MKNLMVVSIFLAILGGFTSCNLPVATLRPQENEEISQKYLTVSALLTKTALTTPLLSDSWEMGTVQPSSATETGRLISTLTPFSDGDRLGEETSQAFSENALEAPCDVAQPGRPIDITVPDDSRFYPGEYFSKTWRLVNAGSCVWTSGYAVVFFSGDNLGLNQAQYFTSDIKPGQAVEVTIEMIAPPSPGSYQSNWKLRNSSGQLFGIGPHGDSPFWARIVVVPLETETATPTLPGVTPTPIVFASGSLSLQLDDMVDLDTGQLGIAEGGDLALIKPQETNFSIAPANGARINPFGQDAPSLLDCSLAIVSSDPVDLQKISPGSYLCYRTTQGLPGRIYLSAVDIEQSIIDFEFVTWVVP